MRPHSLNQHIEVPAFTHPEEFLKKKSSVGLLSQYKWLPEYLLNKAIRDQDLCCLPAF
jgi:hypothetical protein